MTNLLNRFYLFSTALFLCGFFIFPSNSLLHTVFLILVLPSFVFIVKDIATKSQIFTHPLFYCMTAFLLYLACSGFWTPAEHVSLSWYKPFIRSFYILVFCVTVAYLIQTYPHLFDRILDLVIACAGVAALGSIAYWLIDNAGDVAQRLWGITRAHHAIQGAASLGVIFLLALTRIGNQPRWKNILYLGVAALCLAFIIFAQTRGVLIALVAATIVLMLLKQRLKFLFIASVISIVMIACSFYWIDWTPLIAQLTRSMPHRPEIWSTVWQQSLQMPWFGHGFLYSPEVTVSTGTFDHPHNIYLAIFFQGGLIGFALYSGMILCALYYAFKNRFDEKYLFAFVAIVFASIAMLSDVGKLIVSPRDLWLYFWFPLAIVLSTRPPKSH